MNDNDKKIICSAYIDGALNPEEVTWFEEQIENDQSIQTHLNEIRQLKVWTQQISTPAMPHSLEFNWQRFKAGTREATVSVSRWHWILVRWKWSVSICLLFIGLGWGLFSFMQSRSLPIVETAWSPKPHVIATPLTAKDSSVIWISGLEYRPISEKIE